MCSPVVSVLKAWAFRPIPLNADSLVYGLVSQVNSSLIFFFVIVAFTISGFGSLVNVLKTSNEWPLLANDLTQRYKLWFMYSGFK